MKGIRVGIIKKPVFSFAKIYYIFPVIFIAALILFSSCTKQSEFDLGKDFVDSQTRLKIIDTFRVDLSTIIQDSLRTSGTDVALVGEYSDDIFGSIRSETYFDLGFSNFQNIEDKAFYDSAAFILRYNGYSIGDTLSPVSLKLHALTEKISKGSNAYLYNVRSFKYNSQPISTVEFYPEPHSKTDTIVSFKVDELGLDLFNKIRDGDENVTSEEWFMDYLKGFVVTSGSSENNAIIGFDASENKIELKIYYHLRLEEPEKKEITIAMGASGNQFNHIDSDFSGTLLNSIKSSGNKKMASETEYKSYMQGLTGLITKVQFPTLQDIFLDNNWKILKAELVLEPVRYSFEKFPLPQKLYIYQSDTINWLNSVLKDEKGYSISQLVDEDRNALTAFFSLDEILGDDTRYTFDITSYLTREMRRKYFNSKRGLHIGLSTDGYTSTFDRILFEGKKPPVKLRLYYLSY